MIGPRKEGSGAAVRAEAMVLSRKKLCLVDGHSYIHRAYHAVRGLTNRKGLPTNAVFGFANMLIKVLKEEEPDLVAVVFDSRGPTFRHELYPEYKANRPAMPDDLAVQVDYIKKMVKAFGITTIEHAGFEADDILATMGKRGAERGFEVLFITGDKDINQLLGDHISALDTMRDKRMTIRSFTEEQGLEPSFLVQVMALAGDATDNIPGVPGIGPKTAYKLIKSYASLENLYDHLEELPEGKTKRSLAEHREQAFLSRKLVILKDDLELDVDWEKLAGPQLQKKELKSLFEELDFRKFLREMDLEEEGQRPDFEIVPEGLEVVNWLKNMDQGKPVAFSLAAGEGCFYLGLCQDGRRAAVFPFGTSAEKDRPAAWGCEGLPGIFGDPSWRKRGFDLKEAIHLFARRKTEIKGLDLDLRVAAYLIDPAGRFDTLDELAGTCLDLPASAARKGAGGGEPTLFVDRERAREDAAFQAVISSRLGNVLARKLDEAGMTDLYYRLELPLISVLADMESVGIGLNESVLSEISKEMDVVLYRTEEDIYRLAGDRFNINSPKQLASILFEKLKLPPVKKTKTGFSTNEEVLTILAAQHELPSLVLAQRELSKLKNTYVDALPRLVSPDDGRIHTTFNQTVTATGRLSSKNPNLQNIPVRSEWAPRIRQAIVPREGWIFISADYSQIELRILAHLSGDRTLVEAFWEGEDIHGRTAMELFGVPPEEVTGEMRRKAKVINFGIIYGMGSYGLSRELAISMGEAKDYIDRYFDIYKDVRSYLDGVIAEAREKGYVSTLFGRRRYLREFESDRPQVVQFAERAAVNTPIQGTAADLIKMAMIDIHRRLSEEGMQARLLVQIHDELLLESPPEEAGRVAELLKESMEKAAEFSVPIVADLKRGPNWGELRKI